MNVTRLCGCSEQLIDTLSHASLRSNHMHAELVGRILMLLQRQAIRQPSICIHDVIRHQSTQLYHSFRYMLLYSCLISVYDDLYSP